MGGILCLNQKVVKNNTVKLNFVHFPFISSTVGVANSVLVLEASVSYQECTYVYIIFFSNNREKNSG